MPSQWPGTNGHTELLTVPEAKPHLCSTKVKYSQNSCQAKPEEKPEWSQVCKPICTETRENLYTGFLVITLTWPIYYPKASDILVLMLTKNLFSQSKDLWEKCRAWNSILTISRNSNARNIIKMPYKCRVQCDKSYPYFISGPTGGKKQTKELLIPHSQHIHIKEHLPKLEQSMHFKRSRQSILK